jgi:hypothetical protein
VAAVATVVHHDLRWHGRTPEKMALTIQNSPWHQNVPVVLRGHLFFPVKYTRMKIF